MPLHIVHDDITKMRVDAIVNAANGALRQGGGVCGAIFEAAGERALSEACDEIGGCATGCAVITPGFRLPAKYIIHTAGPIWAGGEAGEAEKLTACYTNSLALAQENGCNSIAFPLIASGIYGYPKEQAIFVAVSAIGAYLLTHADIDAYLVFYGNDTHARGSKLFPGLECYIDAQYPAKSKRETGDGAGRLSDGLNFCLQEQFAAKPAISAAKPKDTAAEQEAFVTKPKEAAAETEASAAKPCFTPRFEEGSLQAARRMDTPSIPDEVHQYSATWSDAMEKRGHHDMAEACFSIPVMEKRKLTDVVRQLDESFSERVLRGIDESGWTDVEVYQRANLDRRLFSKIRSDPKYQPSKRTALALAIALRLNLDETRDLLQKAGYALSCSMLSDVIVTYFIEMEEYDIFKINLALDSYGEMPLSA